MMAPEVTPGGRSHAAASYSDRISRLSERLSGLQQGLEHERHSRFENLTHKTTAVESNLQVAHEDLKRECAQLQEQFSRFHRDFEQVRLGTQTGAEASSKELSTVELRLQQSLEAEQRDRREAEAHAIRVFDEKTNILGEEFEREGQTRQEAEAMLRQYVDVELPKLYESLRKEMASREAMEERIARHGSHEIARLQEKILAEKQAREEMEELLLKMVEDTVAEMRAGIAQERAEREAKEETLLKLLEDTCNKLKDASTMI